MVEKVKLSAKEYQEIPAAVRDCLKKGHYVLIHDTHSSNSCMGYSPIGLPPMG